MKRRFPAGAVDGPVDGEWTTMDPLTNGWVAGVAPPQYMKDSRGVVHCRGFLADGAVNSPAFLFPVGYRPVASDAGVFYIHFNTAPLYCYVNNAAHAAPGFLFPGSAGPLDLSVVVFVTALTA